MNELFSRVHVAETRSDNEELRKLLKDVRKEVLLLNKMVRFKDEESNAAKKIYTKNEFIYTGPTNI